MRILALNWRDLAHPAAGGAEVYLESVLARWAREHDVTLFCAAVDGRPPEEMVDGYRVVRRGSRLGVYGAARRWWRSEGHGRFDVVIDAVNTVPFLPHEWVCDGTPTIALVHQTCEEIWHRNAPWPASWLGRWVLEPWWLHRLGLAPTMAVSRSTREALARFGVEDVVVVPEGYETSPEASAQVGAAKEARPTLVWCGRMIDYKRPKDMVEAFRLARREIPDLQLWMVGGGPLLERLRAEAPEGVVYHGRVSEADKHDLMARAHVHAATSVREGWGLVVSEAAALGTPTIAYDVPGLRDSTRAADGALTPPNPRSLAVRIVDLLPMWQQRPAAPIPNGGARSWDDVAQVLLRTVVNRATVPGTGQRPLYRLSTPRTTARHGVAA